MKWWEGPRLQCDIERDKGANLTTETDFLRAGRVILPRTSREAARWPFCRVNYMLGSLRVTVLWVSDMGFGFNCKE